MTVPVHDAPVECDLVAFMAHPDDAELICGGTLALTAARGHRVGVVDFTRGELGSRGTPEIRASEAAAAARELGLACRINLGFPDGGLRDGDDERARVVELLRAMRPRVVMAMPREDHHPDHCAAGEIVARSVYLAGVEKYNPGLPAWRPHAVLNAITSRSTVPDLVVDVSPVMETRRRAVACFRSQFYQDDASPDAPKTRISHPEFMEWVEGGLRRFGFLIGAQFGEGFTSPTPLPVDDPVQQFEKMPWEFPIGGNDARERDDL